MSTPATKNKMNPANLQRFKRVLAYAVRKGWSLTKAGHELKEGCVAKFMTMNIVTTKLEPMELDIVSETGDEQYLRMIIWGGDLKTNKKWLADFRDAGSGRIK